jgi:L-lactate dehydrogenase complex protein LldG
MSQSTARDKILQRLRAANCPPLPLPDTADFYTQGLHEDLPTRIERLALNLTNAMAEVHRTTPHELPAALARVIRDHSLATVAVGPDVLAQQSLCDQLQNVCALLPVTTAHAQTPALFDRVDAGLTQSYAAIAETGTVVLWCHAESPRLLSLVPPVHIVIVDTQRTFNTLYALMQHEHWGNGLPTNVVLVSSPSKTADIQQTLAYGAHGPKKFIVMLVEDR